MSKIVIEQAGLDPEDGILLEAKESEPKSLNKPIDKNGVPQRTQAADRNLKPSKSHGGSVRQSGVTQPKRGAEFDGDIAVIERNANRMEVMHDVDGSGKGVSGQFDISALPREVAQRFDAHGATSLDKLIYLLTNGVDKSREFFTAQLNDGLNGDAQGVGLRTHVPFLVLGHPGKSIKNGGFGAVIVAGNYEAGIPLLQKHFPDVRFIPASEANERMKKLPPGPLVSYEDIFNNVIKKIDEGTVTCDDFDRLIKETTPESIRDRVRRRTTVNNTDSHIDDKGHQQLSLPDFKKRVAPKRSPENQQSHGRSSLAHKHSARTQKRTQKRFHEEIEFIKNNCGRLLSECDISTINKSDLLIVAKKCMSVPNINREWLETLCSVVKNG